MNEIPTMRMSIKLGRARKGKREMGEGKRGMQNEMVVFLSLPSRVFEQFSPLEVVCVSISISVIRFVCVSISFLDYCGSFCLQNVC